MRGRCRRRTWSWFSPGSNAGTEATGTFRRMSCTRNFRSSAAFSASRSRGGRDSTDGCRRSMSSFGSGSSSGTSGAKPATRGCRRPAPTSRERERCRGRSAARMGVRVQGRQGVSVQALRSTARRPRSRRAFGVAALDEKRTSRGVDVTYSRVRIGSVSPAAAPSIRTPQTASIRAICPAVCPL